MRRLIVSSALSFGVLGLPLLAGAATLIDTLGTVNAFLNDIITIFIVLAIVVFFWGLIVYLVNVGEQKQEGLQTMFYGIIAIFVMVSIWGIIALLQSTFKVSPQANPIIPKSIQINTVGY